MTHRILVVDDDQATCNLLGAGLQRSGKTVSAITDPGQALARLLEQAYQGFAEESRRRAIDYERIVDDAPLIVSDGDRLLQVVSNLLENAFEWTPDGGRIVLRCESRTDGELAVSVADSGPGIPADERERIFKPFWSKNGQGTGLGLAIARELAQALGGRLRLDSEVGQGSTFTLAMPAAQPTPLHPTFALLDAAGANVLASGAPVSAMQTCGQCHDTAYIAEHNAHSDVGLAALTLPGQAGTVAPINSTSPGRAVFCLARNHRQAGIWVLKNSWPGSATITSTTSASIMALRISPSLFWLELMEPLASTMPARPLGLRW